MSSSEGDVRRRLALTALGALAAAISGCAQATMIRSFPAGARVSYRGNAIGLTPTVFTLPPSESGDSVTLRLEHDGYRPEDVTIAKEVSPARITGGIFTLGLLWLVKPPRTLPDPVLVTLNPLPSVALGSSPAAVPPPIDDPVEARLRKAKDLYDRGLISGEEYRRYRAGVLQDR